MTQPQDFQQLMHSIIQRVATGPDLSKDISQEEAYLGMKGILEGSIDPVQSAIFFIALRMKRETAAENRGILDAILEATHRVTPDVDELVDIADPYDGYNRCLPAAPFLPALLAELGLPAINHGAESSAPNMVFLPGMCCALPVSLSTSALPKPHNGWPTRRWAGATSTNRVSARNCMIWSACANA